MGFFGEKVLAASERFGNRIEAVLSDGAVDESDLFLAHISGIVEERMAGFSGCDIPRDRVVKSIVQNVLSEMAQYKLDVHDQQHETPASVIGAWND